MCKINSLLTAISNQMKIDHVPNFPNWHPLERICGSYECTMFITISTACLISEQYASDHSLEVMMADLYALPTRKIIT